MAKKLEIMVMTGVKSGLRAAVPPEGLNAGRSSSNNLALPDEQLSRNHCRFEMSGGELTVVDLASANGTFVNGVQLESAPHKLKQGDEILVGATTLKVVGENDAQVPSPGTVDLGLGPQDPAPAEAPARPDPARRIANAIWVATAVFLVVAIWWVLAGPRGSSPVASGKSGKGRAAATAPKESAGALLFAYEKVEADATHIFRYAAELTPDGMLSVVSDDIPQNRHVERSAKMPAELASELVRAFTSPEYLALESEYSGASAASENALKSWRLKSICDGSIKEVRIENAVEPTAFMELRLRIETMVNNALGVQAIQRSREELLESSRRNEVLGDERYQARDVEDGNLSAAIRHFKAAKNDLETLGSQTADSARLQGKIRHAEAELAERYRIVRGDAEQAKQIGDWESARERFRKICEMIPDISDQRHADARSNLVAIESRLESFKKGARK